MEARSALEKFLVAWNTADNGAVQEAVNYPQITHTPFGLVVANEPQQFQTDFDGLKRMGWASSRFDTITRRQYSDQKVNFEVEYSRLDAAGEEIGRGYAFYIVSSDDGHWGVQYRGTGQLAQGSESETLNTARQQVVETVDAFFTAFNAADNVALLEVNHVPQIMLNAGQYIYAEDVSSPIVSMNFDRLRERENWHSSRLGDFEIINLSPSMAIIELSFERFDPDGVRYLRGPAVWVLSKRKNRWGIEFRYLMPPIRQGN